MQDDKLQICKVQRQKIPFPQISKKKVIMTSSFDKKNLGEDPFALGMEIHWDKEEKRYYDYRIEYTQKRVLKKYSMHASKPRPVLLSRVIVLEFSVFQKPI